MIIVLIIFRQKKANSRYVYMFILIFKRWPHIPLNVYYRKKYSLLLLTQKGFMTDLTALQPKISTHNIQRMIPLYLYLYVFQISTLLNNILKPLFSGSSCIALLRRAANTVFRIFYKTRPFCVAQFLCNFWAIGFKIKSLYYQRQRR